MKLFRKTLLLFCLIAPGLAYPQLETLRTYRYTEDNGLSNNIINAFAQDKNGLIWISTMNGLNRFDGIHFRVFRKNYTDTNSLLSNLIAQLAVDDSNRIWIGYSAGGLSCYNQVTNKFVHYVPDSNDAGAMPSGFIDAIYPDKKNNIWFGIARAGLFRLDMKTGKIEKYGLLPYGSKKRSLNWQLHYNRISSFISDDKGILWMATGDGFYSFDPSTREWRVYRFHEGEEDIEKWKPDVFNTICRMSEDDFYLGGWGTGVNHYNKKTGVWKNYLINPQLAHRGTSNITGSLVRKSDHEIWVGSADTSLCIFDTQLEKFVYLDPALTIPAQLHVKGIRTVFSDRDGDLWIGHLYGIYFLNQTRPEFIFTPHPVSFSDNSDYYNIASLLEDPVSGELFVSTSYADGLNVVDRSGKTRHYPIELLPGLEPVQLMGQLFNDSRNTLWVPTRDFLYQYDRKLKKLVKPPQPTPDTSTKGPPFYWKITETADGRLWIATYRHGMYVYDPADGTYTQFFHLPGYKHDIPSNVINGFCKDPYGKIWFGYNKEGVSSYDPSNDKFLHFRKIKGDSLSLIDNVVLTLTADSLGNVWVGTFAGLVLIDAKTTIPKVNNFIKGQELLGITVVDIESDDYGNIWFTNSSGLSMFNLRTGELRNYNHNNGLKRNYENLGIQPFGKGEFALITYAGYYRFRPSNIKRIRKPNPVVITSMRTGDREIDIDNTTSNVNKVELSANDNLFNIEFISLNYKSPTSVNYSYRLSGIDKEWKQSDQRGFAAYTQLPGGEYTFEVRARNSEGTWSGVTKIPIFIATPLYKTTWFNTLMAIIFASAIFLMYRWRIRNIEKTESLKTKFNKQIAETEMRALRAQMNPHFIFNCLNSINRYIIKNDHKTASLYLTRFAKLIRLILDNSESREVALSQELEALKLYIEIELLRFDHKFRYEIEVNDEIDTDSINIPPMVVQPFIENAIWHGLLHKDSPGLLHVRFELETGLLVCTVEDDGVGREKARQLNSKSVTTRKSLGLKITADRIQILNEKAPVKGGVAFTDLVDPEGEPAGTRVTISIPIEND